jgi:hypothetical protein
MTVEVIRERGVRGQLPAGGTAGQVPVKQSAADYDVAWEDQSGGGGGPHAATHGDGGADEITITPAQISGVLTDGQIPAGIARDAEVTAAINAAIAALVDAAPGTLDTLNELAAALGDDANFAATMVAELALKVDKATFDANTILAANVDNTPVPVTVGEGTLLGRIVGGNIAAVTASQARALLALVPGTDIPSLAAFNAHTGATTGVHGIADTARLVTEDASGDVTLDAATLGGGGATVTGGVLKHLTAVRIDNTYTTTADPTDPALGSPVNVVWNPTLNYAGDVFTGPVAQTSFWGPRAVFNLEGRAQYNFSTTTFGLTPLPFGNFLISKNQPGQAKSITPAWQFVAAGIFMADGATVTAVQPDAAEGPGAFYDSQVFITANGGTWDGTTNDVKVTSYVSSPFVLGNSALDGRIGLDIRDVNQYAHGNMAQILDGVLTEDVDDAATPSVVKQWGIRIPRLTFAQTNVGIECNSRIDLWRDTATFTAEPPSAITLDGSFTLNFANATWQGMVALSPTVTFQQAANIFGAASVLRMLPTIANVAALTGTIINLNVLVQAAPLYSMNTTNGAVTVTEARHYNAAATVSRAAGANTFTIGTLIDFQSALTVNTGCTVTSRYGLHIHDATGAGSVTTQIGIQLEALTKGVLANMSIRSLGAAHMRHVGAVVVGADSSPTNTSVALEVSSTTGALLLPRMTTTQRDALTAVNGMVIYNTTANQIQGRVNGAWVAL